MFRKDKTKANKNVKTQEELRQRKVELIEDALLESVSGGRRIDPPLCVGNQFCMIQRIIDEDISDFE